MPAFDVAAAVSLHEEREAEMLASLEQLRAQGSGPRVAELAKALHSLELCDGIDAQTVEDVILRTSAELGHTHASELSHDACVRYYNRLVEYVNSYEARLADPSRNCTPQYTVAGLDMPHAFWINLDRAPDRRANMCRLLKGYAHTRVRAVDAAGEDWWTDCVPLGLGRPLKATAAERCCTMSHLAALDAIAASGVPLALVLEDDVTFKFFPPEFSFERTVSALPDDWELLHVSARSNPPSKLLNIPYQFCEWRPKLCFSTAAYLVNGKRIEQAVAKVRAALLEGMEARADWVLYGCCKTYVLTRPLIDEDPFRFNSAIHSENEEYHRRMHVALSELYCNEARQALNLPVLPLTYSNGYRSTAAKGEKPKPLPLLSLDDLRAIRDGTRPSLELEQGAEAAGVARAAGVPAGEAEGAAPSGGGVAAASEEPGAMPVVPVPTPAAGGSEPRALLGEGGAAQTAGECRSQAAASAGAQANAVTEEPEVRAMD